MRKQWSRNYAEFVLINEQARKYNTTYGRITAPKVEVHIPEWAKDKIELRRIQREGGRQ